MRAVMAGVLVVLAAAMGAAFAQVKRDGVLSGTIEPRDDIVQYTSNGSTAREFYADLKSGRFSGSAIVEVTGTAYVKNEHGEYVAKGDLEVVDGSAAVRGLKGAKFKRFALDLPPVQEAKPKKVTKTRQAVVTFAQDGTWALEDDQFFFLIDSSYGLRPDFPASFARNTRLKLPPNASLRLGDLTVSTNESGGAVDILDGCIVGKQNVRVEKAKQDAAR